MSIQQKPPSSRVTFYCNHSSFFIAFTFGEMKNLVLYLSIILLIFVCLSTSMVIRKRHKFDSWTRITDACQIDFDGNVRFFADDGFHVCTSANCPMVGAVGVYGGECRECCSNPSSKKLNFFYAIFIV